MVFPSHKPLYAYAEGSRLRAVRRGAFYAVRWLAALEHCTRSASAGDGRETLQRVEMKADEKRLDNE